MEMEFFLDLIFLICGLFFKYILRFRIVLWEIVIRVISVGFCFIFIYIEVRCKDRIYCMVIVV